MGQRESRSLRDGNQVAVEALAAFQRDCSLAVGRLESSGTSKFNHPSSRRTLLVDKPPDGASKPQRYSPKSENSLAKAKQSMSVNERRPVKRIVKVRRVKPSCGSCSCCSPAACSSCRRAMLKSWPEPTRLDRCSSPRCTGASSLESPLRSSLPSELIVAPSIDRLAEPDGPFSAEQIAGTARKQSKFYDTGAGRERGLRRLADRYNDQLVTGERAPHLAASSDVLGYDPAEEATERKGAAARLRPSRRPVATSAIQQQQQSSESFASSMASTLTLVSSALSSGSSTGDCLLTLTSLKSPLRAAENAPDYHAASDKDALNNNSNATTTPGTKAAATTARANPTTSPPDHLVQKTPNNVASGHKPTSVQISNLNETGTSTQVFGNDTRGISSSTDDNCELAKGEHCSKLPSSDETSQQAAQKEQLSATKSTSATTRVTHLAWKELALKYGCKMSRETSKQPIVSKTSDEQSEKQSYGGISLPHRRPIEGHKSSRSSCLCHLLCALLKTLFPIVGSLENYSLPGDLASDLAAGFTVAVLHIPQGMAYGLLSGVEPIYGLYVSFIPVLVMSLMSKSRHVSYGTFAVISMLLVNTIDSVRRSLAKDLAQANVTDPISPPLVLTDNHQPMQQFGKRLVQSSAQARDELSMSVAGAAVAASMLIDSSVSTENLATVSEATSSLLLQPPSGIEILACACLVCGLIHVTMSLMRLGALSLIFSDQLVSSFTTASAIHVFSSQIAGLFDLSLPPVHEDLFKIFRIWWNFGHALLFENFNRTTGLLSVCSILFLLLVKQLFEPALRRRSKRLICLPSELFLMAMVILCSWQFKFESNYNVKIIGFVPTGLPEARAPRLELVPYVFKDSITIALISYVMNLSIARVYAKRYRYELEPNQELFALGTANIVSSFFSCFPCASSLSRSSVQSSLNVRSQLCSLFSCALVVLIICFFAHILHDLPRSTLSCIIVVALKGILMQVQDLLDNWRLSKLDALVWIITFVSVIVFGVTYGLMMGVLSSLFMVFLRLLTPNHSILGRLPDTEIYVDVNAFAQCEEFDRVKIFRFNSALCYLNRTQLKSKIEKLFPAIYKPQGFSAICAQFHQRGPFETPPTGKINFLIIDCSAFSYCDHSGAATLVELIEDLESEKVTVYLAACPLKLIDMLVKMKSSNKILSENVYATISDAMSQVRYLLSSSDRSSERKRSSSDLQARRSISPRESCDKSQQTIINLS